MATRKPKPALAKKARKNAKPALAKKQRKPRAKPEPVPAGPDKVVEEAIRDGRYDDAPPPPAASKAGVSHCSIVGCSIIAEASRPLGSNGLEAVNALARAAEANANAIAANANAIERVADLAKGEGGVINGNGINIQGGY